MNIYHMIELHRFELAKKKGFRYDPETGIVYSPRFNRAVNRKDTNGYINIAIYENKKQYNFYAHRYAWWVMTGDLPNYIDHLNWVKDDNRFDNLKNGTQSENCCNVKKTKGYWKNGNKYQAGIMKNGKSYYLGIYDTEEQAHKAYLEAKSVYHNSL